VWYFIHIPYRVYHVREELMVETGAFKGRDLRLEVRRIMHVASRDRHGDGSWLEFMASHRHFVVDVTATSASTDASYVVGARSPLF
jgi:hypothetical protein